jgi:hypothetical protein
VNGGNTDQEANNIKRTTMKKKTRYQEGELSHIGIGSKCEEEEEECANGKK